MFPPATSPVLRGWERVGECQRCPGTPKGSAPLGSEPGSLRGPVERVEQAHEVTERGQGVTCVPVSPGGWDRPLSPPSPQSGMDGSVNE